jgi:hypothetical protein
VQVSQDRILVLEKQLAFLLSVIQLGFQVDYLHAQRLNPVIRHTVDLLGQQELGPVLG